MPPNSISEYTCIWLHLSFYRKRDSHHSQEEKGSGVQVEAADEREGGLPELHTVWSQGACPGPEAAEEDWLHLQEGGDWHCHRAQNPPTVPDGVPALPEWHQAVALAHRVLQDAQGEGKHQPHLHQDAVSAQQEARALDPCGQVGNGRLYVHGQCSQLPPEGAALQSHVC